MSDDDFPLRPFMPSDTMRLRDLFAQSIEELTQDDYDEEQRLAWMEQAADEDAFAKRMTSGVTLVVQLDGEHLGFGTLKGNCVIDLLYVHPEYVGEGVGTALADAFERLAAGRGADAITVDASESAVPFFEKRGYVAMQRSSVPVSDQWLTFTTMRKPFKAAAVGAPQPPVA